MKMEDGCIINGGGSSLEIYPLNRYYFASKEAALDKDDNSDDRIQRLRSNYAAHGLRTCVQGVLLGMLGSQRFDFVRWTQSHQSHALVLCMLLVELFQQPHVLLLQVRNSVFSLPGGRLRPGEIDTKGLKRKLSRKLSRDDSSDDDWEVGECIGMWWRSDFETLPYPYMPRKSKECTKLFLIRLPMTWQFVVPRNMKLLAVPLCQLHDNYKTYGPIISGIPQLLSKIRVLWFLELLQRAYDLCNEQISIRRVKVIDICPRDILRESAPTRIQSRSVSPSKSFPFE